MDKIRVERLSCVLWAFGVLTLFHAVSIQRGGQALGIWAASVAQKLTSDECSAVRPVANQVVSRVPILVVYRRGQAAY